MHAHDPMAHLAPSPVADVCWACGAGPMTSSSWLAPLPFVECAECGFNQRVAPGDAAREHYVHDQYAQDRSGDFVGAELDNRRRDARARLRFIGRHARAGALLDVGTAGGAFLLEAAAVGHAARGIEPTPSFAAYARDHLGLDVQTAAIEDADLPDHGLDIVTMWHVLEHLESPLAALRRVHHALRPGGLLAIEVPNAGSGIARAMRTSWSMLEPDVHVGQFTPVAAGRLVERAGFAVRQIELVSILAYVQPWARVAPRALVHRLKWRRQPKELLRVAAVAR